MWVYRGLEWNKQDEALLILILYLDDTKTEMTECKLYANMQAQKTIVKHHALNNI